MKRPLATVQVFALLLISLSAVWADVVELKTGERIEGTFKQGTPTSIVIEVGGQTIHFDKEKVRAVYFGSSPGSTISKPSAGDEALRALKGLQSAIGVEIAHREYATRVRDTKVVVDRYLGTSARVDRRGRDAIDLGMRYYVLASTAWSASISGDRLPVGNEPTIDKCPLMQQFVAEWKLTSPDKVVYLADKVPLMSAVKVLWSCAADKIAEAEKLLSGEKR